MNKDRIQIDGVWYVKESAQTQPIQINPGDVTLSLERCWETRDWCFTATVIMKDSDCLDDFYPDPSVKITDKRLGNNDTWITHESDNPRWMLGVLDDSPDSMPDAIEIFGTGGLEEFRAFIRHLIEANWIEIEK